MRSGEVWRSARRLLASGAEVSVRLCRGLRKDGNGSFNRGSDRGEERYRCCARALRVWACGIRVGVTSRVPWHFVAIDAGRGHVVTSHIGRGHGAHVRGGHDVGGLPRRAALGHGVAGLARHAACGHGLACRNARGHGVAGAVI